MPRSQWTIEDRTRVAMASGFQPGKIYEVVYTAQDPAMVGLGPTAVRDFISFLKYGGGDDVTILGDHSRYIKRAYGFGVSQSGRFLRTFLYYGFNSDEKARKVFDGLLAHVAGAGRGSFNHRFAQPSRDGHPFFNTLYPTDIFPFTDLAETDPETGSRTASLRMTRRAAAHAEDLLHATRLTNTTGASASLIHTTPDGKQDAPIPDTTRIYFFAGGQHGPAAFPPAQTGHAEHGESQPVHLVDARAAGGHEQLGARTARSRPHRSIRALAPTTWFRLARCSSRRFPGVAFPTRIQQAWHVDYGPQFRTAGIVTIEPPKLGSPFPMRVPQVDADGNDTSGVRMPDIAVPLATYTGWNLRAPAIGAPDELYSMVGSWIPFARNKADRERSGDPRRSMEERYANRAEYLQKVGAAARSLADRGYLLDRDVAPLVEHAGREWDYVTGTASLEAGGRGTRARE